MTNKERERERECCYFSDDRNGHKGHEGKQFYAILKPNIAIINSNYQLKIWRQTDTERH